MKNFNIYTNKLSYNINDEIIFYIEHVSNSKDKICQLELFDFNENKCFDFKNIKFKKIEKIKRKIIRLNETNELTKKVFLAKSKIPNIKSGVYIISYKSLYEKNFNPIFSIVIKTNDKKDITIIYPTNTICAYNRQDGYNLYYSFEHKNNKYENRAVSLPFQRPIKPTNLIYQYLDGFMKYIEKSEFNYKFLSDLDIDDYNNINNTKLIIIIGHSEYWTLKAVKNIEKFNSNGGNLMILSGNIMWWNVKYTDNNKYLKCYKIDAYENEDKEHTCKMLHHVDILNIFGLDFSYGGYGNKKYYKKKQYNRIKFSKSNHDTKNEENINNFNISYNELIKNSRVKNELILNSKNIPGFGGYKIIDNSFFENIINNNEYINILSTESDGLPIKELKNGIPIVDNNILNFEIYKLLGYDIGFRAHKLKILGMIYAQKKKSYGKIFNVGSTEWCSEESFKNEKIRQITDIFIKKFSI